MDLRPRIRDIILRCFDEKIIREDLYDDLNEAFGSDIAEHMMTEEVTHYIEDCIAGIERHFEEVAIEEKTLARIDAKAKEDY